MGTIAPPNITGIKLDCSRIFVERLSGVGALEDMRAEWDELLACSNSDAIFLTWEWARAWWESFGSNHELILLRCTDSMGNLAAIAPMFRTRAKVGAGLRVWEIRLLGDLAGGSEKLDWIIRAGYEEEVVPAILNWIDREAPGWDTFHYNTVRPDSAVSRVLVHECERRKWPVYREEKVTYLASIPGDWPTYLASLSKKMRTSLPQQVRRAEKTFQVCARKCDSLEILDRDLNSLFALHAKRWQQRGKSGSLHQRDKQRFYFELASRCLDRGFLEFWLLEFNGQPVACEFGFTYGGVYSFLQGGFDPDFGTYGVGVVLRVSIIQDLIHRGFHGYDFLLGVDQYKERWGGKIHPLEFFSMARPGSLGATVLKISDLTRRTKDGLRARMPKFLLDFKRGVRGETKPALKPAE